MGKENYLITIIVPVFNEEDSLGEFYKVFLHYFKITPVPTQVLFIDDGSTDKSLRIIKDICKKNNRFAYASLDKNYGLSTAIKAGIDLSNTPYIGYIDSDLQTNPEDFLLYFPFMEEYAMINGIRKKRNDGFIKKLSSFIANRFRKFMINDGITDTCCPLKILKTDYAKRIPFFTGMHRFIPALVQLQGGKVKQIPIRHFPRFAGTSKYHLFNRLVGPFTDTLVFTWMKKRYINYQVSEQKNIEMENTVPQEVVNSTN